jgi:hypothetical protein
MYKHLCIDDMYVCIYVCMCVQTPLHRRRQASRVNVCMHTCMYVCIIPWNEYYTRMCALSLHAYIHTYIHTYKVGMRKHPYIHNIHTYMKGLHMHNSCIHAYIHAYIHTCIHKYTQSHTRTHHTHTHTHTHRTCAHNEYGIVHH